MTPWLYRHRATLVQARQVDAADYDLCEDIARWCGGEVIPDFDYMLDGETPLMIWVPDDAEHAEDGYWVVRGQAGEFFVMDDDLFQAAYEPAARP